MNRRQPPRFASTLLKWLGPGDEAIVGDLEETYRNGKSGFWYWRQVIAAVAAQLSADLRRNPLITLRAIALGFAFTWFVRRTVWWELLHYDEWLFERGVVRWFYVNGYGLPSWADLPATAILCAASGWIVGRLSRSQGIAVVLVYATAIEGVLCALGVWRLFYKPSPVHPVAAIVIVGAIQTLACAFPALLGGVIAVAGARQLTVTSHTQAP